MKYYVYAIASQIHNYIYVGLTNNINRRVGQHNKGKERTTRIYRPFELIYSENLPSRIAARQREKYLKSGSGKEFLKKPIINNGHVVLPYELDDNKKYLLPLEESMYLIRGYFIQKIKCPCITIDTHNINISVFNIFSP